MSALEKVGPFLKKYRFPVHLVVLRDIAAAWASAAICTAWARWMLWLQGCEAGPGLRVDGRLLVRVAEKGAIRIGERFSVNQRALSNLVGMSGPAVLCCYGRGRIEIGNDSGMSAAVISSRARVRVGDRVNIGGNARIYDHDFHALEAGARRDPVEDKARCRAEEVVIGDDVFIGAHAIVLKGVRLGDRSIVGAGAVVTLRDVPADSVVAGNPARVVGRVGGGV